MARCVSLKLPPIVRKDTGKLLIFYRLSSKIITKGFLVQLSGRAVSPETRELQFKPSHWQFLLVIPGLWVKADCGEGGLYSQMSFIYKYKTSRGFIKGVCGGCFVLINKLKSSFTHNPGPTIIFTVG